MKDASVSDANTEPVVQESEIQKQEKKDQVSYESHQRLLKQLKKTQEHNKNLEGKLDSFEEQRSILEQEKRIAEEAKLQEKGEFKKLLELREKELTEMKTRFESVATEKQKAEKTIQDTMKLHAFYDKLPGKVKRREYLSFVNLDNIAINPESGEIDSGSVDEVVNGFMGQYAELVDTSHIGKLPAGHPADAQKVDYENWKNLKSTDMKKNLHHLIQKRIEKK